MRPEFQCVQSGKNLNAHPVGQLLVSLLPGDAGKRNGQPGRGRALLSWRRSGLMWVFTVALLR
jgi:hypothetical protein